MDKDKERCHRERKIVRDEERQIKRKIDSRKVRQRERKIDRKNYRE